jgi:hypothetical protein
MKLFSALILLSCTVILCNKNTHAQDSLTIHFLYGSKPAKNYKHTQKKWFGGKLGGHVGIAVNNDSVLHFLYKGKFHVVANKRNKHSQYLYSALPDFYLYLAKQKDSFKTVAVTLPITTQQKNIFDSMKQNYLNCTPYDYAFIGMRCGAATYDMLAILDIVPKQKKSTTIAKIFYPRKLRKKILHLASTNNWHVQYTIGTATRNWEKD